MASYGPVEYTALCSWMFFHGSQIPDNAVPGGVGNGGEVIYVGRAVHNGDVIPGKVVPSSGLCFVPYGTEEYSYTDYQVLVSEGASLDWVSASFGSVPSGALPGGATASGEQLYIGRVRHEGMLIPGKVHPSLKGAFVSYNGKEFSYTEYEVLVAKKIGFRQTKELRNEDA